MTPNPPGGSQPVPGFDALAHWARTRHPNPVVGDAAPLMGHELRSAFEGALASAKVVSFDVFDTLVLRRVGHPRDVYLHLDRHPAFSRHRFPRRIAELRAEAENLARSRFYERHGTGEVVLPEIYAAFCELAGLPGQAVCEFVEAEEAIELLLCRPNPLLHALFRSAADKTVVAMSDTYHRHAFLVRLLEAVGTPISAESVFVSSERRVNKQSGRLFERVFEHLRLAPADVLHVGDHPVSDYQTPRKLGAQALLHGHHGGGHPPVPAATPDSRVRSLLRAYAAYGSRSASGGGFWWHLGHNAFGPLVVGFALWLRRRFREDGIDRAYFLLRDGEIFHRVYEALFAPSADLPPGRRLPASRRAYVFPLLEAAPDFVLPNLMVCSGPRPVGEFLDRLGIPAGEFGVDLDGCGFRSLADLIDGRREGHRLHELFHRPRVRAALGMTAREEHECLVGYLRQEGVLADGHVALVDLGWHGTVHKAAQLLVGALGGAPRVTGYYLATFPNFRRFVPAGLRAHSYLGGPDGTGPVLSGVRSVPQLLEVVCSSPAGSLRHFARSERGFYPVLQANPAGAEQLHALGAIHDGIAAFARECRATPSELGADEFPSALAAEGFLRLAAEPTKEEAVWVGDLVHGDDFGTDTARALARFRPDSDTAETLWEDYLRAYWKPGMLNQPSHQGNALRTLWWLTQP